LTVDDIGNVWWIKMFERTREDCFNLDINPPFPREDRVLVYNQDIYYMSTDTCY